jgi:hypothetical protein
MFTPPVFPSSRLPVLTVLLAFTASAVLGAQDHPVTIRAAQCSTQGGSSQCRRHRAGGRIIRVQRATSARRVSYGLGSWTLLPV